MDLINYLSRRTARSSEQCIYGLPMGIYAPPGRKAWLGEWSNQVDKAASDLLADFNGATSLETIAEALENRILNDGSAKAVTLRLCPLLNQIGRLDALRDRRVTRSHAALWAPGGIAALAKDTAKPYWTFFEILRAFLGVDSMHAQIRLMSASNNLKSAFFAQATIGYEACLQSVLLVHSGKRISDDVADERLSPMAYYLIKAYARADHAHEARKGVACLPGHPTARMWVLMTDVQLPKNPGPMVRTASRGGLAELALRDVRISVADLDRLLVVAKDAEEITGGAAMAETTDIHLQELEDRRTAGSARFYKSNVKNLFAEWREGDAGGGEIAVTWIPDTAIPASLVDLRAYICFKDGYEPERLIPLDLSGEEWGEGGGTLLFSYELFDTKISAPFNKKSAHIDEHVTMIEDTLSGETVIRIEVHSVKI